MSTDEMFQQATRLKLRFSTSQGQLTVEDLWDIPLTSTRNASLDSIAIDLHIQAKGASDIVSFVTPPNAQIDAAKSALLPQIRNRQTHHWGQGRRTRCRQGSRRPPREEAPSPGADRPQGGCCPRGEVD